MHEECEYLSPMKRNAMPDILEHLQSLTVQIQTLTRRLDSHDRRLSQDFSDSSVPILRGEKLVLSQNAVLLPHQAASSLEIENGGEVTDCSEDDCNQMNTLVAHPAGARAFGKLVLAIIFCHPCKLMIILL